MAIVSILGDGTSCTVHHLEDRRVRMNVTHLGRQTTHVIIFNRDCPKTLNAAMHHAVQRLVRIQRAYDDIKKHCTSKINYVGNLKPRTVNINADDAILNRKSGFDVDEDMGYAMPSPSYYASCKTLAHEADIYLNASISKERESNSMGENKRPWKYVFEEIKK